MVLDERIKLLGSSEFRPQLSIQDVRKGYGVEVDVISSSEDLTKHGIEHSEKALVFPKEPITVPKTDYLFITKLHSLKGDNKLIERTVRDLMFLNPSINEHGIKTMTSWIVGFFVSVDSEGKKRITHEELLPKVSYYCGMYEGGDVDIIESSKIVLYKRDSLLTKKDKIWYSNHFRNQRISKIKGDLIHEAAILASEMEHPLLRINKPIVISYADEINNVQDLNRHIYNKTIRFLEDEKKFKPLSSQHTLEKFLLFQQVYKDGLPLDFYTKALSISKTYAVEFKKILSKLE